LAYESAKKREKEKRIKKAAQSKLSGFAGWSAPSGLRRQDLLA
jgi:hypothetical protein